MAWHGIHSEGMPAMPLSSPLTRSAHCRQPLVPTPPSMQAARSGLALDPAGQVYRSTGRQVSSRPPSLTLSNLKPGPSHRDGLVLVCSLEPVVSCPCPCQVDTTAKDAARDFSSLSRSSEQASKYAARLSRTRTTESCCRHANLNFSFLASILSAFKPVVPHPSSPFPTRQVRLRCACAASSTSAHPPA